MLDEEKDQDIENHPKESLLWQTSSGKPDPGAEAAMRRATIKARKRAIALTGRVVTFRDGEIVYDTEP